MKKHYETHVEDTDKLISVAGPELDYKSWYEQYRKLMEEQAQRKYGLYTPTSEGDDDDFPSIPGMIARYSAKDLTNEQMAANPVWVDKTGNGHDLQMKNFAWGGMSGVGGYEMNFNLWTNNVSSIPDISMSTTTTSVSVSVGNSTYNNNLIYIHINNWDINKNHWLKVTSTYEDGDLVFKFYNDNNSKNIELPANGYVNIPAHPEFKGNYMYISTTSNKQGSFTIEQLPLYPGFILGDGVNDFAVTEKELNFEDTYTVYTPVILLKYSGAISGKSSTKDFSLISGASSKGVGFDSANQWSGSVPVDLFEFALVVCKRDPETMYVKDLITGKAKQALSKEFVPNPGKYFIWRNTGGQWSQVAIAGQIICNGHFSTDEEDAKVLNWYKKQYPWLFPDQAWTVVGKTNEDEDRATIANITGNGNDLVLSNFGFAEGSGYGLYKTPFELYPSVQHSSKYSLSFSKFALGDHNLIIAPKQNDLSYDIKVKVTGLKDGVKFKWGWIGTTGYIDITTDGIHMLNKPASQIRQLIVEFAEDFDPDHVVTIEQIPEYEGYLVTDGVDDMINSSNFDLGKDWTIVGDWTMLSNIPSNCGIIKAPSLFLYNSIDSVTIYINNGGRPIKIQSKSINAICSDGRIYLNDWTEISKPGVQTELGSKANLNIASYGTTFTKMAFKNLAIYDGKILSKDDCIKAYNYLQTLKAK